MKGVQLQPSIVASLPEYDISTGGNFRQRDALHNCEYNVCLIQYGAGISRRHRKE